MECFLLYLDDLEDWIYAVALVGERIRRGLKRLGLLAVAAVRTGRLIFLALRDPALGAAVAALLAVVRSVPVGNRSRPMVPHGT